MAKERHTGLIFFRGFLRIGDPIEESLLGGVARVHEILPACFVRLAIEPHEATEHLGLKVLVAILFRAEPNPVVQELWHFRGRCTGAALVGGDNQIAKDLNGLPLVVIEDFALERLLGGF